MQWSYVHPNSTKLAKDKTHQAFWPFVAPQNVCVPYREEMTKFNACATYKGLPRAKTVRRQWTPVLHQYATSPQLTRFSRGWSHAIHKLFARPRSQHPVNYLTTHQLILNHQHHQQLSLIYLNLPTHHQTPIPDQQLHTMRPQITPLRTTITTTGATTHHGGIRRMNIAATTHHIVKVVLETNIVKATLDPALQHTTTPDRAGKHYIIAEYFVIWRVPQESDPVSLVAPTDSFGVTMLLPTFGTHCHFFRENVYELLPAYRLRLGFTWCFTQTWSCHIMFHTFQAVWPFRITFSPLPQFSSGLLLLFST